VTEDQETSIDETQTGEMQTDAESQQPSYVTADQLEEFGEKIAKTMMGNFKKVQASMMRTQSAPEPKVKSEPKAAPSQTGVDVQAILNRERKIGRAINRAGFSESQEDLVRSLIEKQDVDDVGDFITDLAKQFGVSREEVKTEQPKRANPTPSSDGGLPAMTRHRDTDDIPVWHRSKDWCNDYQRRHGKKAFVKMAKESIKRHGPGVALKISKE